MSCPRWEELSAHRDGDAPPGFAQHLDACPVCRTSVETLDRMEERLLGLDPAAGAEDPTLADRLLSRLPPRPPEPRGRVLRFALPLAAAALIPFALIQVLNRPPSPVPPPPAARPADPPIAVAPAPAPSKGPTPDRRRSAPRDRATEALERFLAAPPGGRHQHVAALRAAARVAGPGPLVARLRRIARRGADAGAVIETAYVLDGPEATTYLGELARDPRTGPEAVNALSRLGTRSAVTALVRCAAAEPSEGAVRALREARDLAREVLLADLDARDDATRLRALALLARLGAPEVIPAADREARRARDPVPALRALARLGTTDAFEALLSLGGALGKEATVAQVIRGVSEAAIPALQELIHGRNREVAFRAVEVLAGIDHPSAIVTLEGLLDDRSGLAPAVVRALARVQGPEATELLHEARARPSLRWEAELALRERAGRNL